MMLLLRMSHVYRHLPFCTMFSSAITSWFVDAIHGAYASYQYAHFFGRRGGFFHSHT